ncbi:hypothetical protein OAG71_02350 [bacterium]|nr:hypothetical protein [bacterium]
METEPRLTAAALAQHLVADLLHQQKFPYAHFPELVDLAVVMTGLGTVRSGFEFVKRADIFWDSTYWGVFPRPFLDTNTLGYTHAMAAWIRDDRDPSWFASLPTPVKSASKKSLKFLLKTGDSFFSPTSCDNQLLDQSQPQWQALAAEKSTSKQIIAIRHFAPEESLAEKQSEILLGKLRSSSEPLTLHAITAVESLKLNGQPIADQLNHLTEHHNDELRAKAMIALTKLGHIDQHSVTVATKMISNHAKHVVYAGMFALSSQSQVDESTLKAVDRGFMASLQTCDYEFIQLYTTAYSNWMDEPQQHIEHLLNGADEYLEIANEALQASREQTVALG